VGRGPGSFVVGGVDGLSRAFIEHADKLPEPSPMTLPRGLARLVLIDTDLQGLAPS